MPEAYEQTPLWKHTLAKQSNDKHQVAREVLRVAYQRMRKNTAALVSKISENCPGLTVHDVTHLDALWETASLVAGPEFDVTPAEAFVFGGAVLLHDAGTSVAAFPGGLPEIVQTTEYQDAVHSLYRKRGIKSPIPPTFDSVPEQIKDELRFSVLRALHARQASKLATTKWRLPGTSDELYLLEDQSLRHAYGSTIGRIAYSHHWDIDRVATEFRPAIGAAVDLPTDWTVNEIKVACLLRCADITHIDERRAPSVLYALSKPDGVSDEHWRFQNKLNKAVLKDNHLVYTSGTDFGIDDAAAWWRCWDTIAAIDKELANSNAVLRDKGVRQLAAERVMGAESPRSLSHYVRPNGWRPVDASIRVSDPIHLARTLGGGNLYGKGAFAPLRELLQNAIDAIHARRGLENRGPHWGKIRVILERVETSTSQQTWLHVDDNGVGMSERILAGSLVDFGRSLWNSPMLQEEFPGLESTRVRPIGKFGIGFFSIFLLGDHVRVISRPYNAGIAEVRMLEFASIQTRPILRDGVAAELPTDFSTRVSVKIPNLDAVSELAGRHFIHSHSSLDDLERRVSIHELLRTRIRQSLAALDIEVEVFDKIKNSTFSHAPDWATKDASAFLDELLVTREKSAKEYAIRAHKKQLTNLVNKSGETVGRAALWMFGERTFLETNPIGMTSFVSVGGFAYPAVHSPVKYVGILAGDTQDVTRSAAIPAVSRQEIVRWASEQATLIDRDRFQIIDQIAACHAIVRLGGNPGPLPFCYLGGQFVRLEQFNDAAAKLERCCVPLSATYSKNFEFQCISKLDPQYFMLTPTNEVVIINSRVDLSIFEEERGRKIIQDGERDITLDDFRIDIQGVSFDLLLSRLKDVWGAEPRLRIDGMQVFSDELYRPPQQQWVLTILR